MGLSVNSSDSKEFLDVWDQAAELYGKTVKPEVKRLALQILSNYSLMEVKAGLAAHMSDPDRGQFHPKPADVIRMIQVISPSAFPGAEQAWAQFPRDETDSACICNEMATAWGVACGLDEISGRMAFKEAYDREVANAKARKKNPAWFITTGTDKMQREQVTLDAVRDCLITPEAARVHLPHVNIDDLRMLANHHVSVNQLIENNAQTVNSVGQLLLPDVSSDKCQAIDHIKQIRDILSSHSDDLLNDDDQRKAEIAAEIQSRKKLYGDVPS